MQVELLFGVEFLISLPETTVLSGPSSVLSIVGAGSFAFLVIISQSLAHLKLFFEVAQAVG